MSTTNPGNGNAPASNSAQNISQPVDPTAERLKELRALEVDKAINDRRTKAGVAALASDENEYNLVGVGLSGGGIRSAVYNLGFLQALSQRGLLRHVDYLCTVSGGGYIGGHLAALADNLGDSYALKRDAAAASGAQPPEPASFHDDLVERSKTRIADLGVNESGQLQPEYRFRHVGEYLFADPFQFIWRYIACTLPMLILAISSMGFLAVLVALIWRSLDSFYARDLVSWSGLHDMGLDGEFVQAFLPCILPAIGFCIGCAMYWIGSFRRSGAWRRSGAFFAKWSVVTGIIFLACSIAVFLGNGESAIWLDTSQIKVQSLTWPLLALTIFFLVPMVRFRSVVNSAREGAPAWQAAAARFIIAGACTCTPFFLVHWMSRENISGWVTHRNPDFDREDILHWPAYVNWRKQLGPISGSEPNTARLNEILERTKKLEEYQDAYWGGLTSERQAKLRNLERGGGFERIGLLAAYLTHKESDIQHWFNLTNDLRQQKKQETDEFSATVLGTPEFTRALHQELYDTVADEQVADIPTGDSKSAHRADIVSKEAQNEPVDGKADWKMGRPHRDLSNDELRKFVAERVINLTPPEQFKFWGFWDRARSFEVDQHASLDELNLSKWPTIEIKQFNRLMMEVLHPEFVRERAMVSTQIVPYPDQVERLRWLAVWSGLLILSCILVDFNRTSPFYMYYRDRLHRWFLQMPTITKSGEKPALDASHHDSTLLRDLTPWQTGAPYPLFLASLHLFNRISPRRGEQRKDAPDAESCLPLLFSPLKCGSSFTRYVDTTDYCNGRVSVADAVAISGAAVTPFMTQNSGLLAMMAALNLRIGKWLPRPDCTSICGGVARMFPWAVALEFWRSKQPNYRDTWKYGLAADGGFHEFFGLEELLLRRCRLIIISDAGCNNGKFEFGALADTIRLVRERHGIEFLDLDHDQPVDLHRLKRKEDSSWQRQHHICLRVRYPENFPVKGPAEAMVVYAQMSLTGDEPLDLQQFRQVNPNFPDEPTTNQSYDEHQVESFRQLGHHVGIKVCQRAPLGARRRDFHKFPQIAVETWMDWLRWGYIADCSQADKLPKNRFRHIDPRVEGSEFEPERRQRIKELLPTARDAFKDYLRDPQVRQDSLVQVSQLLKGDGNPAARGASSKKLVEELVKAILACHDSRADFHCSDRRSLFVVGGRRHLIRAASLAASEFDALSHLDDAEKPIQDIDRRGELCALAARFYWRLNRGIFKDGNARTAALATLYLVELLPVGKRIDLWAEPLDCVCELVKLAKQAKLWKATQLIESWYVKPTAAPPGQLTPELVPVVSEIPTEHSESNGDQQRKPAPK